MANHPRPSIGDGLGPYLHGLGMKPARKSRSLINITHNDPLQQLREEMMTYTNNLFKELSENVERRLTENNCNLDAKLGSITTLLEHLVNAQNSDNPLNSNNTSCSNTNNSPVYQNHSVNSNIPNALVFQNNFIKPDTFDGSVSFESYLRSFEIAAKHNSWTLEQKASFLATSLRGKARNVLENLSHEDLFNFEKLKYILVSKFGQSKYSRSYFNQIQCRKQQKEESLENFAEELEKLARLAFPNYTEVSRDNLTCQYFISGIYSNKLQISLRSERIESLHVALERAMELDSIYKLVYSEQNSIHNDSKKDYLSESDVPHSSCWTCGKFGHKSWNCRLKNNNVPGNNSQKLN